MPDSGVDRPVAVLGVGATGAAVVQQLTSRGRSVFVTDTDLARQEAVTSMPGAAALDPGHHESVSVVVLAVPRGRHVDAAHRWLVAGAHVVSIADDPTEIRSLLELHDLAVSRRRSLVVGAGFAPGMTGLLARHGADFLDEVSRVAVATTGTGGPACARQHHRAFKRRGTEWWDRRWRSRRGGSARELMWFPDPIGARDCYRADLADPFLIHRGLPSAERIIARMSATRRDRLTARLPMLRQPHADGGPGAIRVEVRGRRAGAVETLVYGVHGHPSVGAAAVATQLAMAADSGEVPVGAIGTAEIPRPVWMLARLRSAGVCIETYESSR